MDMSMPQLVFPPSIFDPIARLFAFKMGSGAMARMSLLDTMRLARPLQCSDNRDRIYGLLDLDFTSVANPKELALLTAIVPDYTKSTIQVYRDFAVLAFDFGIVGEMLRVIHHGPTLEEWHKGSAPSWMPRWDKYYSQDFPALSMYEEITPANIATINRDPNHPSQAFCEPYLGGLSKTSLFIPGSRIACLTAVSDVLCDDDSVFNLECVVDFWTCHLHSFMSENTETNINSDLCKALTFYFPSSHHIGVIVAYFEHNHLLRSRSGKQIKASVMLESLRSTLAKAEKRHGPVKNPVQTLWIFRTAITHALRSTRLFLTNDGRIGLCSATARVGDYVVLVYRAGCPMLLRPQEAFYRLVGGSYVPSLNTTLALSDVSLSSVAESLDIR